jgi:hypothetical protein
MGNGAWPDILSSSCVKGLIVESAFVWLFSGTATNQEASIQDELLKFSHEPDSTVK